MSTETIISKPKLNVAIVGSRQFNNYDLFKYHINQLLDNLKFDTYRIISGGALGTDSMAKQYAIENKIEILEFLPDWRKGKVAGILRNTDIINNADWVIAFSMNNSNGTNDSIKKAKKANKRLNVIYIK